MGWRALFELLNRLARWLGAWLQRRSQRRRQAARNRLEADPAGWYRRHFGGMRNDDTDEHAGTDTADPDDTQ